MCVDIEQHDAIKRRLRARRITFVSIAQELGVSPVTVTRVSQGYRKSDRIQRSIAEKLGVSPEVLWPGKYV
ncbi:MAG: helix-turn-helix domain-containing protein [Phyllobacterium sp.]